MPMTQEERDAQDAATLVEKTETHKAAYYTEKLNGGITVGGVFISTGAEDRNLINGAVTRALLDNDDTITYPYYPTGGSVIILTNAQYKAIGVAVANHAQKCLDAVEAIKGTIYATIAEVEAAFDAEYEA